LAWISFFTCSLSTTAVGPVCLVLQANSNPIKQNTLTLMRFLVFIVMLFLIYVREFTPRAWNWQQSLSQLNDTELFPYNITIWKSRYILLFTSKAPQSSDNCFSISRISSQSLENLAARDFVSFQDNGIENCSSNWLHPSSRKKSSSISLCQWMRSVVWFLL